MGAIVEFLNHIIFIVASFHHFGQRFVQRRETLIQPFKILTHKVDDEVPLDLFQQLKGHRTTDRLGLKCQSIKSVGRIVEQRCPLINTEVVS